jgi:hypothetical protein
LNSTGEDPGPKIMTDLFLIEVIFARLRLPNVGGIRQTTGRGIRTRLHPRSGTKNVAKCNLRRGFSTKRSVIFFFEKALMSGCITLGLGESEGLVG